MATKATADQDVYACNANMRAVQIDFIKKAADSAKCQPTKFVREAILTACEKQLGEKRPDAKEFTNNGQTSQITQLAEEAGVSVAVMTRRLALKALGQDPGTPAPKAKKAKRKTK